MLKIENLSKHFKDLKALNNISLEIKKRSITGLIGKNGAGKSTLIRTLVGLYKVDSGSMNAQHSGDLSKNNIGYLPEERGLYKNMTVKKYLTFCSELHDVYDYKENLTFYLKMFSLDDKKNSKIETLSKGNQQKVQIIASIIHNPNLIIFDEPFSGLDPITIDLFYKLLLKLKSEGKTIILSTHLIHYAEKLCDQLVILDQGIIKYTGSTESLINSHTKMVYQFKFSKVLTKSDLIDFDGIENTIFHEKKMVEISFIPQIEMNSFLQFCLHKNISIIGFNLKEISLHDLYINMLGDSK